MATTERSDRYYCESGKDKAVFEMSGSASRLKFGDGAWWSSHQRDIENAYEEWCRRHPINYTIRHEEF